MLKVMIKYEAFWTELIRRHWTARDLAREAGLTYGSVLQVSNGNATIGPKRVASILKALKGEVKFDDIFEII